MTPNPRILMLILFKKMSGFLRKELTLEQLKQAFHQVPPALAQNIPILNIIIIINNSM